MSTAAGAARDRAPHRVARAINATLDLDGVLHLVTPNLTDAMGRGYAFAIRPTTQ